MDHAVDRHESGVDAGGRHELVLGAHVRGRKPDLPPAAGTTHDGAVDEEVVAEERRRLVDAALGDEPAHARAADDEVLVADRVNLLGAKAIARAERTQDREGAGAVVAEQEIGADPHFGDVQPFDEHRAHEALGIPGRQLVCEVDDRNALHAGTAERLELLLGRHQERRRLVRPQHARRVRIEGHRRGRSCPLAGAAPHPVDDLHVTAVQPIEVPERDHRLMPARRGIVWKTGDVHEHSTTSPS